MLEIIYIHIPKTGGTSVLDLFKNNFQEDEICEVKRNIFKKNPTLSPADLILHSITPATKILHGHFTYNELAPILHWHPGVKIITFLRDPVERVISNYHYFKTRLLNGKVPEFQQNRIEETLTEYVRRPLAQNRMCHFLNGTTIENLYFVGLLEFFESDLHKLFDSLNLKINSIPKININKDSYNKQIVSPQLINEIKTLNVQDERLYLRALEIRKIQSEI